MYLAHKLAWSDPSTNAFLRVCEFLISNEEIGFYKCEREKAEFLVQKRKMMTR